MAKTIKQCRVCGKDYEYCHTFKRTTLFRWQDVACSPECGNIYFERILRERSGQAAIPQESLDLDNFDDEDDYIEEFEIDFDEEDDEDDF